MNDDQIKNMLKDIVEELDYDLYKSLFVKGCIECPEEAEETIDCLLKTVRDHLQESRS